MGFFKGISKVDPETGARLKSGFNYLKKKSEEKDSKTWDAIVAAGWVNPPRAQASSHPRPPMAPPPAPARTSVSRPSYSEPPALPKRPEETSSQTQAQLPLRTVSPQPITDDRPAPEVFAQNPGPTETARKTWGEIRAAAKPLPPSLQASLERSSPSASFPPASTPSTGKRAGPPPLPRRPRQAMSPARSTAASQEGHLPPTAALPQVLEEQSVSSLEDTLKSALDEINLYLKHSNKKQEDKYELVLAGAEVARLYLEKSYGNLDKEKTSKAIQESKHDATKREFDQKLLKTLMTFEAVDATFPRSTGDQPASDAPKDIGGIQPASNSAPSGQAVRPLMPEAANVLPGKSGAGDVSPPSPRLAESTRSSISKPVSPLSLSPIPGKVLLPLPAGSRSKEALGNLRSIFPEPVKVPSLKREVGKFYRQRLDIISWFGYLPSVHMSKNIRNIRNLIEKTYGTLDKEEIKKMKEENIPLTNHSKDYGYNTGREIEDAESAIYALNLIKSDIDYFNSIPLNQSS